MIVREVDGYTTEIESPSKITVDRETGKNTLEVIKETENRPNDYWVFYMNRVEEITL
jgi:hypothetical protein